METRSLEERMAELEAKIADGLSSDEALELAKIYKQQNRLIDAGNILWSDDEILRNLPEEGFLLALEMGKELGDLESVSVACSNLAYCYQEAGDFKKSLNYILEVFSIYFDADLNVRTIAKDAIHKMLPGIQPKSAAAHVAYSAASNMLQALDKERKKNPMEFIGKWHIEEAQEFIEAAIDLNPTKAHYYYAAAYIQDMLGNPQASREHLEKAVSMDDTDINSIHRLANMYYETGRYKKSAELWARVNELDPAEFSEKRFPDFMDFLRTMGRLRKDSHLELTDAEINKLAFQFCLFSWSPEMDLRWITINPRTRTVSHKAFRHALKAKKYNLAFTVCKKILCDWTYGRIGTVLKTAWKNKDYAALTNIIIENQDFIKQKKGEQYLWSWADKLIKAGEVECAHDIFSRGGDMSLITGDETRKLGWGYFSNKKYSDAWNCFECLEDGISQEDWARIGDACAADNERFFAMDAYVKAGMKKKAMESFDVMFKDVSEQLFSLKQGSTKKIIFDALRQVFVKDFYFDFDETSIGILSNNDVTTLTLKYNRKGTADSARTFVVKQFDFAESGNARLNFNNEKTILSELSEKSFTASPSLHTAYQSNSAGLLVMSYLGGTNLRDYLIQGGDESILAEVAAKIADLHSTDVSIINQERARCLADESYFRTKILEHFNKKTHSRYKKFLDCEIIVGLDAVAEEIIDCVFSAAQQDPMYFYRSHHNNIIINQEGISAIDYEGNVMMHPGLPLCYLTEYGLLEKEKFRDIYDSASVRQAYIEKRKDQDPQYSWVDDKTQKTLELYAHMAFLGSALRDILKSGSEEGIVSHNKALYHVENIRKRTEILNSRENIDAVLVKIEEKLN